MRFFWNKQELTQEQIEERMLREQAKAAKRIERERRRREKAEKKANGKKFKQADKGQF